MKNDYITKYVFGKHGKGRHGRPKTRSWTKLNRMETWFLEVECLRRLTENFKCQCDNKYENHFPKLVSYDINNKSITMANCGETLVSLRKQKKFIEILDYKEQCACISKNLKENGILHCDLNPIGNNVCLNEKTNCISVIDFDWVKVDGYMKSNDPINSKERLSEESWGENLLLLNYENYINEKCDWCNYFGMNDVPDWIR